jgi:peptidoglycan/LPS O-acetylase OafA/YrhL
MLRGASVLYIVGFWHLMEYAPIWPGYYNPLSLRATVIVLGLFTFLSGWLLGQRHTAPSMAGLKQFYMNRFFRIYPLYLGAIGLFFICHLSEGSALLKAALLVSMFDGPQPPTLWFITILVLFYFVAPPLIYASNGGPIFWALAAFIFGSLVLVSSLSTAVDPRLVVYFPAFVGGIYLAHRGLDRLNYMLAFSSVGFLLSIVLSVCTGNNPEASFWSVPLACLGPVFIFLLSWRYKNDILYAGSFAVLGYVSYVAYLIHRPVFVGMKWFYFPSTGIFQLLYLIIVCLPLTFLASWLIQRSYDATLRLLPTARSGGT